MQGIDFHGLLTHKEARSSLPGWLAGGDVGFLEITALKDLH